MHTSCDLALISHSCVILVHVDVSSRIVHAANEYRQAQVKCIPLEESQTHTQHCIHSTDVKTASCVTNKMTAVTVATMQAQILGCNMEVIRIGFGILTSHHLYEF